MSVTLIAEKAGVSIATVSRVLNKSRPVNPEMAKLVHQAIEELQLPPRQVRKRLRPRSRTRARTAESQSTIAIVSLGQFYRAWFEVPVIANIVAELSRASQEAHIGVLMTEMIDPTRLSPVLRRPEVEGAIVFVDSSLSTKDVVPLRDHLPVVKVMGAQVAPVDVDHVGPDNNAVGYLAAEHLVEQGARQLAFLTTRPSWDLNRLRVQGFIARALESGISPMALLASEQAPYLDFYGPHAMVEPDLPRLVSRLASHRTKDPLGLFVSRDEETVQVYQALREIGLQPGRDVTVVSCDNETVRLSTLQPRPLSIDLNAPAIAQQAVTRLLGRIRNPSDPPTRILVNPRLQVDDTTPTD